MSANKRPAAKKPAAKKPAAKKSAAKKPTPQKPSGSATRARAPGAAADDARPEKLIALIKKHGLAASADAILQSRAPTIRLVSVEGGGVSVGASRLGGDPDLPQGFAWPKPGARPLSFIAQLELAKLRPYDVERRLPSTGVLSFFYDAGGCFEGRDTDPNKTRVFWFPEASKLVPCRAPAKVESYSRCGLRYFAERTLPFARTHLARRLGLDDYFKFYCDARELMRAPRGDGEVHRVLGNPDAIQGDMTRQIVYEVAKAKIDRPKPALEAEADKLRLLLQIDSDERADMMWGDLGRLFFWIREDDLAAANFSNVTCVLQCG